MTEKDLTKAVRHILKTAGVWHYKHWQGPMSSPGVSDIIGIRSFSVREILEMEHLENVGVFFACELKKEGGKATEAQERFIRKVRMNGGIGFVADNVDAVIDRLYLRRWFLPLGNNP